MYPPSDDSYLLAEVVKDYIKKLKNKNIKVLDLGTGSGIQSENLIKLGIKKENITASDIDKKVLAHVKKLGIKTIESNLFQNIKGKFDIVIFNPPYLPEHEKDKGLDTSGGKKGDEIIVDFLSQIPKHLTERGVVFLLTSSHTPNSWKNNKLFSIKKVKKKKIFFEELYVWMIAMQ